MSNTDSFIDEVTEEVRRDTLSRALRRYGWIALVVVVAIVGGAAYNEVQKSRTATASRALGDAMAAAFEAPDAAARAAALVALAPAAPEAAALVRLSAAAELVASGTDADLAAARAVFDAIAGDTRLGPEWRDLAQLRAVLAAGTTLDPAAREAALAPLTAAGRPYRVLAQEQIALARIEAGNIAGAREILTALSSDRDTPAGLRTRVGQMLLVLGDDVAG